jgi:hypothetical protein
MIDDDDRARDARAHGDSRPHRDARPHHMVESDGELLDIGPNAETIDDAGARSTERLDLDEERRRKGDDAAPRPRTAPRFGSAGSGGAELEPGPEGP